jgi:hypothetical protein
VLIGLYAGNDLADAYAAVHRRGLAPELLPTSPESTAIAALAAAQPGDLGDAWEATRSARRGRFRQALRGLTDPIEDHSRLFGLLRALARALDPPDATRAAGPRWKSWDHYARVVAGIDPELMLPFHDGRSGTILTPAARAAVLDGRDPRVREGERIGLQALREAVRLCDGHCQVAIVAIPTKERVYAEALRASAADVPAALTRLVEDEEALFLSVRRACEQLGADVIDPLARLRAALARGESPYPPDWNGHPNAVGNDAIALAIRDSLEVRRQRGSHTKIGMSRVVRSR